jgi:hypothetical protein
LAARKRLRTLREQVAQGLVSAGLEVRSMRAREIRLLAYRYLNPNRAEMVGDPWDWVQSGREGAPVWTWTDCQSVREQLAYTTLRQAPDHLVCGRKLIRVLTLKGLPTHTEPALLEALRQPAPPRRPAPPRHAAVDEHFPRPFVAVSPGIERRIGRSLAVGVLADLAYAGPDYQSAMLSLEMSWLTY